MRTCVCTLAGTKACENCSNNGGSVKPIITTGISYTLKDEKMNKKLEEKVNIILGEGVNIDYDKETGNFIIKGPLLFELVDWNTFKLVPKRPKPKTIITTGGKDLC